MDADLIEFPKTTTTTPSSAADTMAAELIRIGQRIADGHDRARRGERDWIEGSSLEMAAALAEGRDQFPSDVAFGDWLTRQGHSLLNKNDRAALINLGRDIPTARKVLEETESRSYRLIWDEAKDRFPNTGKPPVSSKRTNRLAKAAKASAEAAEAPISATSSSPSTNPAPDPYAADILKTLPEAERNRLLANAFAAFTNDELRAVLPAKVKADLVQHAVDLEKSLATEDMQALEEFADGVCLAMATNEPGERKAEHIERIIKKFKRRNAECHHDLTPSMRLRFNSTAGARP